MRIVVLIEHRPAEEAEAVGLLSIISIIEI